MSGYRQWTDPLIGLEYAVWGGVVHYCPSAPFYVDGIRYDMGRGGGPLCRRVMIDVLFDGGRDTRMDASRPPTERELDHYVKTGCMDGRQP